MLKITYRNVFSCISTDVLAFPADTVQRQKIVSLRYVSRELNIYSTVYLIACRNQAEQANVKKVNI